MTRAPGRLGRLALAAGALAGCAAVAPIVSAIPARASEPIPTSIRKADGFHAVVITDVIREVSAFFAQHLR